MKNICILLVMSLVVLSCKNVEKPETKNSINPVSNAIKASSKMDEMKEEVDDLTKLTPLTIEDFKAWLPDEIIGMKRTGYKSGQTAMMNIASIEGTYKTEDKSKELKIYVIDRAGETAASATMGITMAFEMEFNQESDGHSKKTVTKNGNKAIEEYYSNSNRSEIQLLHNTRFYIKAEGKNMNIDETWKAIKGANLDQLD